MSRSRSSQMDFFDELAADQLVVKPPKQTQKPAVSPIADVHRGRTSSERNRNAALHRAVPRSVSSRQRVLDCIVRSGAGGMTREEIAIETGMKVSSVCGRVSELLRPKDPTERPSIGQNGTKRRGPSADSEDQVVLFAVEYLRFTELPDSQSGSGSDVSLGEA